jgi:hypothetical protein
MKTYFHQATLPLCLQAGAEVLVDPWLHVLDLDGRQGVLNGLGGDRHHPSRHGEYGFGVAVLVAAHQLLAFADRGFHPRWKPAVAVRHTNYIRPS